MSLSNKEISQHLFTIAAQPLNADERFCITLDGLTLRCSNTRAAIELMAGKFSKNKSLKTKQKFPASVSTKRENPAALLKRLKLEQDPDLDMFDALLNKRSLKEVTSISLIS